MATPGTGGSKKQVPIKSSAEAYAEARGNVVESQRNYIKEFNDYYNIYNNQSKPTNEELEKEIKSLEKIEEKYKKIAKDQDDTIVKLRKEINLLEEKLKKQNEDIHNLKLSNKENEKHEELLESINDKLKDISSTELEYNKANLYDKQEISKSIYKSYEQLLKTLEKEREIADSLEDQNKKEEALKKNGEEKVKAEKSLATWKKRNDNLSKAIQEADYKGATIAQKIAKQREAIQKKLKDDKIAELFYEKEIADIKNEEGISEEERAEKLNKIEKERQRTIKSNKGADGDFYSVLAGLSEIPNILKSNHPVTSYMFEKTMGAVKKGINEISKNVDNGVNRAIQDQQSYFSKFNTRLQTTTGVIAGGFEGLSETVSDSIASSPLIKQQTYLQKIAEFVEKGVGVNLEQRALIATLSDRMVTTFDALDANLLRLTRIQGHDLTATQLGSEAQLTQFLNSMFGDTSYLSDMYQDVQSMLFDTVSLMNVNDATSVLYNAQKWLASLYESGVSQGTIQKIAEGLNYLGTGNVSALSSNSALQTLLVSSANQAGLDYSSILTNGLNANSINSLMSALVKNLQNTYLNMGNRVVGSAWSNVLGVDLADLRAIYNLNNSQLSSIAQTNTNYESAYNQYKSQLSQVENRTALSSKISNYFDNMFYDAGSTITSDNGSYLTYLVSDYISKVAGDSVVGSLASSVNALTSVGGLLGVNTGDVYDHVVSPLFNDNLNISSKISKAVSGLGDVLGSIRGSINEKITSGSSIINGGAKLPTDLLSYSGEIPINTGVSSSYGIDISQSPFSTTINNTPPSGRGYSSSDTSINSTAVGSDFDKNMITLQKNAEALSVSALNVSSIGESELIQRDISDLYAMLFEAQTVPIRVKLADVETAAVESLRNTNSYYPVDVKDEDINSINDAISRLQLVRNDYYFG